jgi:aldose 1-epimerase
LALPDGAVVKIFTLTNAWRARGSPPTARCSPVASRTGPEAGRRRAGFDDFESYLKGHPFFGNTTGRYANRIAGARFTLDGTTHTLAANNGTNHIHGGPRALDKQNWTAETLETPDGPAVRFHHLSPDGAEGYPGNLHSR